MSPTALTSAPASRSRRAASRSPQEHTTCNGVSPVVPRVEGVTLPPALTNSMVVAHASSTSRRVLMGTPCSTSGYQPRRSESHSPSPESLENGGPASTYHPIAAGAACIVLPYSGATLRPRTYPDRAAEAGYKCSCIARIPFASALHPTVHSGCHSERSLGFQGPRRSRYSPHLLRANFR